MGTYFARCFLFCFSISISGCIFLDYSGYVEGKVIDEKNQPIEGVAVSVNGFLMTTDKNGCFEFNGAVDPGVIELEATKRGRQYVHYDLEGQSNRVFIILKSINTPEPSQVDAISVDINQLGSYSCDMWGS